MCLYTVAEHEHKREGEKNNKNDSRPEREDEGNDGGRSLLRRPHQFLCGHYAALAAGAPRSSPSVLKSSSTSGQWMP